MSAYLESLAEELKDYEITQKNRQVGAHSAASPVMSSTYLRALVLLRAEAMRVSASVVVSASLANHDARIAKSGRVTNKLLFTPDFAPSLEAQMHALSDDETFFELQQLWLATKVKLLFARDLSSARAAELRRAVAQPLLHADVVADAWRRACVVLRELIAMIIQLMDQHGVSVRPPVEIQSIELLREAEAGLSPCLESDGSFSLPGWAERRKERRRPLVQNMRIGIGIKTYPARTENLSSGGLQITSGFMMPVSSRVVVHLDNGRRLDATVRWSEGTKAGLAFVTPLGDRDPLWSAADDETKHVP